ncbi:MAG TPA: hypothetical protein VFA18_05360 [Gemmataceae bacterium]|nr:hypothetical protein [Gemmataceae bacterium]
MHFRNYPADDILPALATPNGDEARDRPETPKSDSVSHALGAGMGVGPEEDRVAYP